MDKYFNYFLFENQFGLIYHQIWSLYFNLYVGNFYGVEEILCKMAMSQMIWLLNELK